jgi:hypothetical protein
MKFVPSAQNNSVVLILEAGCINVKGVLRRDCPILMAERHFVYSKLNYVPK